MNPRSLGYEPSGEAYIPNPAPVIAALIILLAGCQSIPEVPTVVKIPYAVPCISEIPPKPALVTDAELLAMPDAAFVIALAADRIERGKWMAVAEALLSGCVK